MKKKNINIRNKKKKSDTVYDYKHKIIVAGMYIVGLILFTKVEYDNYKLEQEEIKQRELRRKARRNVK